MFIGPEIDSLFPVGCPGALSTELPWHEDLSFQRKTLYIYIYIYKIANKTFSDFIDTWLCVLISISREIVCLKEL